MGEVTELRQFRLSVSQIASEFGMARSTVAKRIDALGIKPDGKRMGWPVYRLRDIVRIAGDAEPGEENDPMRMRPTDRRAWFQSENERLKLEVEQGLLIPASEFEAEIGEVGKIVSRAFSTLPDKLERDLRIPPEVVEYVTLYCRESQAEIYTAMRGEVEDARESA